MTDLGYATRLTQRAISTSSRAQPPPDSFTPSPAQTQLLGQRHWPNLTAQLHQEPACVGPVLIPSAPAVELVVQLAGSMQFGVTGGGQQRRYHTAPGTLFLTPAHRPAFEVEWLNVAPEPVRTLHVYLPPALLARTAAECGLAAGRVELRDDSGLQDPLLYQLGLTLAGELAAPTGQSALYGETIAQLLAVHLLRQHSTHRPPAPERRVRLTAAQVRRVHEYVDAHLSGPIRLADLAALVCLSAYHFCRQFKRATGQSPNQYVIGQRMHRACCLVQQGGLSVLQVAYAVGYQNPSHFAELYRRHTGTAPAAHLREGGAAAA